jgi:hypothetical protein
LIPSQTLIDKETKEAIISDLLPNIKNPDKDFLFYTMWIVIEKSQKILLEVFVFMVNQMKMERLR